MERDFTTISDLPQPSASGNNYLLATDISRYFAQPCPKILIICMDLNYHSTAKAEGNNKKKSYTHEETKKIRDQIKYLSNI